MKTKEVKITKEDLKIGMEFWILKVTGTKETIYKDKIVDITRRANFMWSDIKLSKFKYQITDTSLVSDMKHSNYIQFRGSNTLYYVFTTQKKAHAHLFKSVLPRKLQRLERTAQEAQKQFQMAVDAYGVVEKQIEAEKKKLVE